jgi:hypothetical protein
MPPASALWHMGRVYPQLALGYRNAAGFAGCKMHHYRQFRQFQHLRSARNRDINTKPHDFL